MIAKKCDKCGAFYVCYNMRNNSEKPNGFQFLSLDESGQYFSYKAKDLCQDCLNELLKWWNGGNENAD